MNLLEEKACKLEQVLRLCHTRTGQAEAMLCERGWAGEMLPGVGNGKNVIKPLSGSCCAKRKCERVQCNAVGQRVVEQQNRWSISVDFWVNQYHWMIRSFSFLVCTQWAEHFLNIIKVKSCSVDLYMNDSVHGLREVLVLQESTSKCYPMVFWIIFDLPRILKFL